MGTITLAPPVTKAPAEYISDVIESRSNKESCGAGVPPGCAGSAGNIESRDGEASGISESADLGALCGARACRDVPCTLDG